jgi:hypothetical protein
MSGWVVWGEGVAAQNLRGVAAQKRGVDIPTPFIYIPNEGGNSSCSTNTGVTPTMKSFFFLSGNARGSARMFSAT